ncbi:MAG: hypothetical protein ABID38_04490 [Candidatus Diapherotrites archaeon]
MNWKDSMRPFQMLWGKSTETFLIVFIGLITFVFLVLTLSSFFGLIFDPVSVPEMQGTSSQMVIQLFSFKAGLFLFMFLILLPFLFMFFFSWKPPFLEINEKGIKVPNYLSLMIPNKRHYFFSWQDISEINIWRPSESPTSGDKLAMKHKTSLAFFGGQTAALDVDHVRICKGDFCKTRLMKDKKGFINSCKMSGIEFKEEKRKLIYKK